MLVALFVSEVELEEDTEEEKDLWGKVLNITQT